jgi:hypothetical protein
MKSPYKKALSYQVTMAMFPVSGFAREKLGVSLGVSTRPPQEPWTPCAVGVEWFGSRLPPFAANVAKVPMETHLSMSKNAVFFSIEFGLPKFLMEKKYRELHYHFYS